MRDDMGRCVSRVERRDVGPMIRATVSVRPTSFSLTGVTELIAELTKVRDGMLADTVNHYTVMAAEAEAGSR